jgi:hypothetical protein
MGEAEILGIIREHVGPQALLDLAVRLRDGLTDTFDFRVVRDATGDVREVLVTQPPRRSHPRRGAIESKKPLTMATRQA